MDDLTKKTIDDILMNDNHQLTDRAIIRAENGWTIVRYHDGMLSSRGEHIIAWAIERHEADWGENANEEDILRLGRKHYYYEVIPITVEGNPNNLRQQFVIKEPGKNGWYILPMDTSCESKHEMAALLEQYEQMAKEREENKQKNSKKEDGDGGVKG